METAGEGRGTAPGEAELPGDTEQEVLRFLQARTRRPWQTDTDLFAKGGLSSLFAMELVVHLEKSFGVSIRGADLRLDNFRTVEAMTALVQRLRASAAGARGE
ncbi:acyl carrier protein [Streptomyces clavuligerus]|uniref:Methoxymalonate biosynthesis D-alanyl carrier protein n=1 Tax=Streptomyces clavuligerus TaxID=1901 RepID=B5H3D9_STRCL|nr:acyl carrier protein [Streptomyces clavuligerus]ANW21720.1 methoxymalonate biosynthesis protein [Streptomyces clavuligerus]AXU16353.1 acyl carrier protein [Streptomyces clavuligerus]EDY53085.1 methoxymalonate biosynthesis protein [Streptomyces clavuligerus]EFG05085.1 Methoxymalonate biosynthesis D-alanyl carrier protein [Streptomyces clavuligerus]MBY6306515.1 acyl carrier protein [Streptomyces clavuligerus]